MNIKSLAIKESDETNTKTAGIEFEEKASYNSR